MKKTLDNEKDEEELFNLEIEMRKKEIEKVYLFYYFYNFST